MVVLNHTATTAIYTLSLDDALPIWTAARSRVDVFLNPWAKLPLPDGVLPFDINSERKHTIGKRQLRDLKSTRLNSSHSSISYAVFCLKTKILSSLYRCALPFLVLSL